MKKRKAFTLIELLVVIAIIALLLSIMMPALGVVKAMGKQIACGAGNLKTMAMVNALYAAEYDGKYMPMATHNEKGEVVGHWPSNRYFLETTT